MSSELGREYVGFDWKKASCSSFENLRMAKCYAA